VTEDQQRRIPHVRELAVAGDFALIGGHSAFFLGRLLAGYPGGLERLLARSGIAPDRRDDVMRAAAALVHVGATWRVREADSGSGTPMDAATDQHAGSRRGGASPFAPENGATSTAWEAAPFLSSTEAASALALTARRVRRLAQTGVLRGLRDAGGRWQFAAADVAAERERRMILRRERHA
jgi:hypothetical protein